MKRLAFVLLIALLALANAQTLDQRIAGILPKPEDERWLQINWQSDLMKARAEAQRLGRPLFLWVMDGHPLACT